MRAVIREYLSYPTKTPKTRADWFGWWVMVLMLGLLSYLRHRG